MDLHRFIDELPGSYYAWGSLGAYPRDALRYVGVLDTVQGMTTPSTMHLLNTAVRCMAPGEVYLEVGTWRGATFIGALLENDARGIAIDNDTMDEHDGDTRQSRDVWMENVARAGIADRARYVNASVPAVWQDRTLTGGAPVGVYFFDGDKTTPEDALDGLYGVVPFLADRALIVIDDANAVPIRQAVFKFMLRYSTRCAKIFDFPTPANGWPSFWNGCVVIAWGVMIEW